MLVAVEVTVAVIVHAEVEDVIGCVFCKTKEKAIINNKFSCFKHTFTL